MIRGFNPAHVGSLIVLVIGLILTTVNLHKLGVLQQEFIDLANPGAKTSTQCSASSGASLRYTVYGKNLDSGYLKHVYAVLERAGYKRVSYNISSDWDVMWAHDYPFKKIKPVMMSMKSGQKVNKLPGSGYVTNKVNLATSGLKSIPPAFKIPNDTLKLMDYAKEYPDKMFVQKNSNHRGIKIEKLEDLDLKSSGSFVQEFIHDPFLIDGYKFDIGVYTMITSINPLRIYVYNSDVLIRFCPKKYHPFDPKDRDKYVVHDDYKPTWEVPTLAKLYSDLSYTFKETLNTHIRSVMSPEAPAKMWNTIYDIIRDVYTNKESDFAKAASNYPHPRAFFEMVRFDFVLDSKLNVYLMEVNMSPNLSTKHFSGNRLLYEQAIYNLLRLVRVSRPGLASSSLIPSSKEEAEMQVSDKDISVFSDDCVSQKCSQPESCDLVQCRLCKNCLSSDEVEFLKLAYLEQANRHATIRIYPKVVSTQSNALSLRNEAWKELTDNNAKMHQWFVGKCIMDQQWCL
jgi:tubulin monoglycylase TTLL15